MVKRNNSNSDIDLLLGILLASSVIIGAIHHWPLRAMQKDEKNKTVTTTQSNTETIENPLIDANPAEVLTEIRELIRTDSIEKAIKMVTGIPIKTMMPVLNHILKNAEHSSEKRNDRIELLVGVAATYKEPKDQYAVLDLIFDPNYLYLREGTPILYIAAYGNYPQIIPTIKAWYAQKVAAQPNHAELSAESEARALAYAVENKKIDELKAMAANGITLDTQRMNALLIDAIRTKAGCPIIEFLLDKGADINGVDKGYTPLLQAIKNSDLAAVKLLIKRGADLNKIGDNAVGNPRQVAKEAIERTAKERKQKPTQDAVQAANDAITIESFLIKKGAQD